MLMLFRQMGVPNPEDSSEKLHSNAAVGVTEAIKLQKQIVSIFKTAAIYR